MRMASAETRSRGRGGSEIGVEGHAGFGKRGLHLRHVHRVAPDHQLILARGDQVRGMARRMPEARYGGYAGKHLTLPEQSRPVPVGRDLFTAGHKIKLCRSLVDLGHRAVVEPVRQFVLVHDKFRVRKQELPVRHVGQAGRMIRVHVGQQHRIDRLRVDAGGSEVALNEAGGGLQVVARSSVDDRGAPF
jgi:hypothetical protein